MSSGNERCAGGKQVCIAIVGLGYWGPNLVRVLHELDDVDVRLVCDIDPGALKKIGRRYPAVSLTTSFDDVLADDGVDAVVLATPVSTHYELAAAALARRKHVFVEKPLAASAVEAEELLSEAEAGGLTLMPGHTFLYSPPVNMVRDMILAGELGDIYFISMSRVNLGIHQADVSVAWDLGPHDFSILRYWLDEPPTRVWAVSRGCIFPSTPDIAFINLEFPCGTLAHVELSWLAPSKLRRTAIVGSRKMAVYDDTSSEPVRIFDSGVALPSPNTFGEYRLSYRTGQIVSPPVDAVEPLLQEMRDFVRSIQGGEQPRSSARLGLDVVRIVESVDASLRLGGGPAVVSPVTEAPAA